MLHQCGNGNGRAAPPCSCAFLFPSKQYNSKEDCNLSSSVDCTLSLGTPSTRQTNYKAATATAQPSFPTQLCSSWDIRSHSGTKHSADSIGGGDPLLLARRCANCDTTSTPLWRNGPRGPKSLCNACGIRYKKEERRAAASPSPSPSPSVANAGGYGYQRATQSPWSCYAPTSAPAARGHSMSMYDEFRVMAGNDDHVVEDEEREVPYLSWRLNVLPTAQFSVHDRPSLFQYQ